MSEDQDRENYAGAWSDMGCGTVLVVLILCVTAYAIARLIWA